MMQEKDKEKDIDLARVREQFSKDLFATEAAGAVIVSAGKHEAVCELALRAVHLNARGAVMGGAIFTLADFTVAVAANGFAENPNTVTLHAGMTFLSPAKGKKLICRVCCLKAGRTTCLYEATVTDELGTQVACGQFNGFTLG